MRRIPFVPLLLLFSGCAGPNSQIPSQFSTGSGSTQNQSNAQMNFQPSIVIRQGEQLGEKDLAATLLVDIQNQERHLLTIEEIVKAELALTSDNQFMSSAPPLLNTLVFHTMRVAYPKEFLAIEKTGIENMLSLYGHLEQINSHLSMRSQLMNSALSNAGSRIRTYDQLILDHIRAAREFAKNMKLKR